MPDKSFNACMFMGCFDESTNMVFLNEWSFQGVQMRHCAYFSH